MNLNQELLEQLGFVPKKHIVNGIEWWLDLGRMRHLLVIGAGTASEIVFLVHIPKKELGKRFDPPESVCVSNYDYDGLMSRAKLDGLLIAFGGTLTVKSTVV